VTILRVDALFTLRGETVDKESEIELASLRADLFRIDL